MEEPAVPPRRRRRLLAKFTGASMIGFLCSAAILRLGMAAGLEAWSARLIGLLFAMHVTFLINGRFVFKALTRERFLGLWAAYVANSAVGNGINYLVFLSLVSSHQPVIGDPTAAFLIGSVSAWTINFLGARFLVFGEVGRGLAARVKAAVFSRPSRRPAPAPAEPAPSARRAPSS